MSDKARFRYSKAGRAKYISHLDLLAAMRRALLRAGLELKYSEGFNPHPYISVALPLSVGIGSRCELMDVGLAAGLQRDGVPERVNIVLPEGLSIIEIYTPERKFNDIAWIEIDGILYYDAGAPRDAAQRLAERFERSPIIVPKKTKSGLIDTDISPAIRSIRFVSAENPAEIAVTGMVSAQAPSLNPEYLIAALMGEYETLKPDYSSFIRTEVFDKDMNVFR